ncbi:MAG: DUF262 domain-containing protein [Synergistaceae bacterium]|jgi:uncharacterized protein with ParB-like and HNH nuclease domain|nr:DUF262 domain-containing protein [Synergistaceae bacterium]
MSFQTPITIAEAIENVQYNKFLLPAIQREFVWSCSKIEWLFDSLMRNYPISSFLFWNVEGASVNGYRFYKFINEYREKYKTHNEEISTDGMGSFNAILDGQQRLTSLYVGLKGSYAYKEYRKKWENSEWSIPTRRLYLNFESTLEEQEDGRIYEFRFLKDSDSKQADIYKHKWFRIGKILELKNISKFNKYVTDNGLSEFSIDILARLQEVIHSDRIINYFLEKEQDLDKALNIFIRINSGGEPLNFSDLLMSIAVANWTEKDAKKEIHNLVDSVRDKGFSISKDLVLKTFLVLYSKDIKFRVTNFSKDNAKEFETEWEKIRDAILSTFDLLKTYGFTDFTLTSKNAIIPIVYYLYHKRIYRDYSSKIEFKDDREIIKKWLHIVLIKKIFGGQADSVLTQIRQAFTSDIKTLKIKPEVTGFPVNEINKNIKKDTTVGDEFIEDLLYSQKDDQYTFSTLAVLYPNLDYKNNDFHKDHIHPAASYDNLTDDLKEKYGWWTYNSIYNLQMLDANENMSKNDKSLKEWIDAQTQNIDKNKFLENHLIPDIDFELDNFEEYIKKRKGLLISELKKVLN